MPTGSSYLLSLAGSGKNILREGVLLMEVSGYGPTGRERVISAPVSLEVLEWYPSKNENNPTQFTSI